MTQLTAEGLRAYLNDALSDTNAFDALMPYADELERLRGPGNPTQSALDAVTKPLHAEIERLAAIVKAVAKHGCQCTYEYDESGKCLSCRARLALALQEYAQWCKDALTMWDKPPLSFEEWQDPAKRQPVQAAMDGAFL